MSLLLYRTETEKKLTGWKNTVSINNVAIVTHKNEKKVITFEDSAETKSSLRTLEFKEKLEVHGL